MRAYPVPALHPKPVFIELNTALNFAPLYFCEVQLSPCFGSAIRGEHVCYVYLKFPNALSCPLGAEV